MSAAWLPSIWFGIIAFEICLYILLDGADLGIGMLSLFKKREHARALMMHVIGPIWDANETWLVIAGGTLFGAFPEAYGIILNALYIPVMLLIFGIILRAASFEFHEYGKNKNLWSFLFGFGSLLAVLGQGSMAGGLLSGIAVVNGSFAGSAFDWATPLTLGITATIIVGYMIIGYAYLVHKHAHAQLHEKALYPFMLSVLALGFVTVTALMMPYIIPPSVTVDEAASSTTTLRFMLYGIGPLIPIILAYNLFLYRVFRDERAAGRTEHYG